MHTQTTPLALLSGTNGATSSQRLVCRAAVIAALLGLLGCGGDAVLSPHDIVASRTVAFVGQQLSVRLQSIGPGEYAAPPAISSSAVRFLKVALVGPAVPAGVTQRFFFRAAAPGQAVVTFQHSGISATVIDTIDVQ